MVGTAPSCELVSIGGDTPNMRGLLIGNPQPAVAAGPETQWVWVRENSLWLQIEPVRGRQSAGETNRERELGLDRRETG
jgi:hypothetical protein